MPNPDGLRWALCLFFAAVLVFVGSKVVSLGIADHLASIDPDRALRWRSEHPEALLRTAERGLGNESASLAPEEAARRALAVDPLDGRSLRVLGQLRDLTGRPEEAVPFYEAALARSPRDLAAQARMADYYLAKGEFDLGIARLDMMLRVSQDLLPRLRLVLISLAGHPLAAGALADRVAQNPPWRASVMREIIKSASQTDAISPLIEALRQREGGLSQQELSDWVDRLVADGEVGRAYLTWVAALPETRRHRLGNVYNGGFEWPPEAGGFDWRFRRVPGARIDRGHTPGSSGNYALRIVFEDRRVPFAHVSQMLALPPGRYRLAGKVKPDRLRTERGLVWQVVCIGGGGNLLGVSEPFRGDRPWRDFSLEFDVPSNGCPGQWLRLRHSARIEAEQRIGGTLWFDDIRVTRLP